MFDHTSDAKRDRAREVVLEGSRSGAVISHQVVQETLNAITRKIPRPLSPTEAQEFFRIVLARFWKTTPTPGLYLRTLDIQGRYGFSFWDSMIVASALEAGCTRLLTEDLQHGQVIEGLRIENPFR